jgi:nucleotide-binding universal stress UspA family protein
MFRNILVGYQETEQGRDALALARVLAEASGAVMLMAAGSVEDSGGLARLARSQEADLIVLGPTHRGPLGRVVPGGTAERLLAEAPCAIAVAPPGFAGPDDSGEEEDTGLRVIGVGFDGSDSAHRALGLAAELAVRNRAALRVYAIAPRVPVDTGAAPGQEAVGRGRAQALRQHLHDTVAELPSEARALPVFLWGNPAVELVAAVDNGIDLIVLGSRGGGPVRRALYGSVSSTVIQRARCPALISPAGVAAPVAEHV